MRSFYGKYKDDINRWLLIAGFVLGLYIFVIYVFSFVAPFVIGFVIALILEPLVSFLQKKFKLHRGVLAFFSVAITAALIIFVGTRIVISIFNEATSFIRFLPQLIQDVRDIVDSFIGGYQNMVELVPEEFQYTIQSALDGVVNSAAGWATSLLGSGVKTSSGSLVRNFPNIIMSVFFSIISAFFFIKDKQKINSYVISKCHPAVLKNYGIIRGGIMHALAGYFRAQLIIMSFTAIISITGLTVLNYQYALLIGLVIAIVDGLPMFGSGTILIPWAIVWFSTGNISPAIGILIIYGIITLTRQTLEPKVVGEQIGVYPLLTLMSIYIGLRVFGVLGFLIGPIVIVTIKVLNEAWTLNDTDRTAVKETDKGKDGLGNPDDAEDLEDEYV